MKQVTEERKAQGMEMIKIRKNRKDTDGLIAKVNRQLKAFKQKEKELDEVRAAIQFASPALISQTVRTVETEENENHSDGHIPISEIEVEIASQNLNLQNSSSINQTRSNTPVDTTNQTEETRTLSSMA